MAEFGFRVSLPNALLKYGYNQKKIQQKLLEWAVVALFNEGQISSGKAARFLNISRIEFLDLLRERGYAYVDYSPEEMEEEFKSVKALRTKKSR